jgi:hypothetical protein
MTRTGRLDFDPYTVAYDKATSVWTIRAIDAQARRVEDQLARRGIGAP